MTRGRHAGTAQSARPGKTRFRRLGALEQLESRCLMAARVVAGHLTITGDDNPQTLDDEIIVDRDAAQPALIRVTVNGSVVATRPERRLRGIRIFGGNGSDTISVDESHGRILLPVSVYGGAGDDEIRGASGRDLLDGGPGRDSLAGGDNNDRLRGGDDPNRLDGGDGDDQLRGGPANDTIWGGPGDDRIDGLAGRDRLHGGDGRDNIQGGLDNDTLIGHGGDPISDRDAALIRSIDPAGAESAGEPDDDQLNGGPGDNLIVGGMGSDRVLNGRAPESLAPIGSCQDVATRLAELATQQYEAYITGTAGPRKPGSVIAFDEALNSRSGDLDAADASSAAAMPSAAGGESFSDTNTQEIGVDEADIVKTDGSSIFVLRNQELIIVDAVPAADAAVISRTEIEGDPIDMFLRGSRVMIFSTVFRPFDDDFPVPIVDPGGEVRSLTARPFWLPRRTPTLKVTVLDVSDPAAPSVIHESFLDGSYINARAVDGQVYLVLGNSPHLPLPIVKLAEDGSAVESPGDFQNRLSTVDPATFLPQFRSVDYTKSGVVERVGNLLVDCDDLYKTPSDDFMQLTTVLSFDLDAETIGGPRDSATVFGYVNMVYASTRNLYLIRETWQPSGSVTAIHKIALGDDIELLASGEVLGNVLNQFSVDEQGDYFRIATTSQSFDEGGRETENNVYVLAQDGDALNVIGSIENLAPGERIFSARFFDEEGFVVTFRQVDPLFALDLSNPTDPRVAGVLKIPGYSAYLHPFGEDHLLAIGRDADETGRIRGLQVSLFNVSDLATPTLADQFLIQPEGDWSWSAAEWDHHAFGFFPEFGVLSIPVSGSVMLAAEDDGDPNTLDFPRWTFRCEFWVFQVDLVSGIDSLGRVTHDTHALRSLRINDVLYTLASDDLKAQPILNPTSTTSTVSLSNDQ